MTKKGDTSKKMEKKIPQNRKKYSEKIKKMKTIREK